MRLIRNTILTAFALLLVHYLFVRMNAGADFGNQGFWQENRIKAQNFLYDHDHPDQPVLLGTSVTSRLNADSLSGFTNLGLDGQCIFDGFELIKQKAHKPKFVFVEMNFLLVKGNESFTSSLLVSIPYFLSNNIPSMQVRYQPANIIGSGLITPLFEKNNPSSKIDAGNKPTATDPALFEKLLQRNVTKFTKRCPEKEMNRLMNSLAMWMDYFRKNNITVVFYELPVNKAVRDAAGAVQIREAFYTHFPKDRYLYIETPDVNAYQTTDGVHLEKSSAAIYSGYFRREAERLMSGK